MKISCFYIMTEPEKMGFPYMESIISSLSICDEVIIVLGRDEEVSERKINNLKNFLEDDREACVFKNQPLLALFYHKKEIKVIKTNTWPEKNWNYDVMRDHFRIGLESCTGDLCMKIDADHVFRNQYAEEIIDLMIAYSSLSHIVHVNLINFYRRHRTSFPSMPPDRGRSCYIINKKKLKEDNLFCQISNKSGSNQPEFIDKNGDCADKVAVSYLGNLQWERHICDKYGLGAEELQARSDIFITKVCPINYSYTFCTKEMASIYWARWHNAVCLKFNRQPSFDVDNLEESFKNFMRYYYKSKLPRLISTEEEPIPGGYQGQVVEKEGEDYWFFGAGQYILDPEVRKAIGSPPLGEMTPAWWNSEPRPRIQDTDYAYWFPISMHPSAMWQKLMTMDETMWGYNNFKDDWEKIKNGKI